MLNHCNNEKIYHTLENTKGFKAVRFELATCVWCALGKSTRAGLSHTKNTTSVSTVQITIGNVQYQVALSAADDCVRHVATANTTLYRPAA